MKWLGFIVAASVIGAVAGMVVSIFDLKENMGVGVGIGFALGYFCGDFWKENDSKSN